MEKDKSTNKYLICGYSPELSGGVPRLMDYIIPRAKKAGYIYISFTKEKSFKYFLNEKQYFQIILEIIKRCINYLKLYIKSRIINNSTILFIHPQKSGFRNLFYLSKRNKVFLYVVDNSFFCIRSYNIDPSSRLECLNCLGNIGNIFEGCKSFPIKMTINRNLNYLNKLKEISDNIVFLLQNKNQEFLVKNHFGDNTNCQIVGLNTGEIMAPYPIDLYNKKNKEFIVYHGSMEDAKGFRLFLNIAVKLENYNFFFPYSKFEVEKKIGSSIISKNITFEKCTWETGLKELVCDAIIVMNPTLWSAPIEGALLKSIFYNGFVATVETINGFESELKEYSCIVRLNVNPSLAANQLEESIKKKKALKNISDLNALKIRLGEMNSKNIFEMMK
jgi:hypothetical protein